MSDFFDDEFSAYDLDLSKLGKTKAANTVEPPVQEGGGPSIMESAVTEPEEQTISIIVETPEENPKEEENNKLAHAARQAELEEKHKSMGIGGKKELTKEDVEQMIVQQAENANDVKALLEMVLRMADSNNNMRKPKGLITIKRQIERLDCIFIATKALLELYVKMDMLPLYKSLDNCELSTVATNTHRQLKTHKPTIQEGLHSVEAMMNEHYDRPAANLRMRIIKGQIFVVLAEATNQAKSLAQAIEAFPQDNGSLIPQCLMAEKGDNDNMKALDNTLLLAESIHVLTKDAPAMLEALKKKDMKTICTLQKNLIEYQTEQKN